MPTVNRVAPILIAAAGVFFLAVPTTKAQLDLNRDGFLDVWQIEFDAYDFDFSGDRDDDEAFNGFEALSGTDPDDDTSFLEATKLQRGGTAGSWQLSWETVESIGYQVQVSASPNGPWEDVGGPVTGDGNGIDFEFDGSGIAALQGAAGYARIRVVQIDADGDGVSAYEERLLGTRDDDAYSNTSPGGIDDLEFARQQILATGEFGLGGLDATPEQIDAARLLTQATFGPTMELIDEVAASGLEQWIDNQMALPASLHRPLAEQYTANLTGDDGDWEAARAWAWWENTMNAPDLLRQRVAFALSEIFVISDRVAVIHEHPVGTAAYYDILVSNAFSNYSDLIREVTLSPIMGVYLSHLGNRKTNESLNIFPDENYAREVMQLFSIGLYELNADGSRKQNASEDIPTYDNFDITEMAKVFTGLNFGGQEDEVYEDYDEDPEVFFDLDENFRTPMEMYDFWHEPGAKTVLGTVVDEATPLENVDAALEVLAAHENAGPYLGHKLIQRLVKSNPSPAYIARISAVWDNDGNGVRGNLGAVVKAILLDPEARDRGTILADNESGKLREPLMRFLHLLRAFDAEPSSGRWRMEGDGADGVLGQFPLRAPSVFNFYLPDFQPIGVLSDADLVAPEFQIMNSLSAISFQNLIYGTIMWDDFHTDAGDAVVFDYSDEEALFDDPVTLMDRLGLLLGQGKLSDETYETIVTEVTHLIQEDAEAQEIIRFAITAIAASPDFNIYR